MLEDEPLGHREEDGAEILAQRSSPGRPELLLEDLAALLGPFRAWMDREVPATDGGVSLGQVALTPAGTDETRKGG
jgi:hypothetical protein